MTFELIRALAQTELADDLHIARLLLLLDASAGRGSKPVDGITKLAKLDFLLRYPVCLQRALDGMSKSAKLANIKEYERFTIESKMIRFRYGPWDYRYRRWIALLTAKGLARTEVVGRTVKVSLTDDGRLAAADLGKQKEMADLKVRAKLVAREFGSMSGTALASFLDDTFPEITNMRWGKEITI